MRDPADLDLTLRLVVLAASRLVGVNNACIMSHIDLSPNPAVQLCNVT